MAIIKTKKRVYYDASYTRDSSGMYLIKTRSGRVVRVPARDIVYVRSQRQKKKWNRGYD